MLLRQCVLYKHVVVHSKNDSPLGGASCKVRQLSSSSAKSDSCLTLQLAPPSGESCLRMNNYMFIGINRKRGPTGNNWSKSYLVNMIWISLNASNFSSTVRISRELSIRSDKKYVVSSTHHAEGRVDPRVRERQNGFRFWIPQSM
jgi:hypothetical protein